MGTWRTLLLCRDGIGIIPEGPLTLSTSVGITVSRTLDVHVVSEMCELLRASWEAAREKHRVSDRKSRVRMHCHCEDGTPFGG